MSIFESRTRRERPLRVKLAIFNTKPPRLVDTLVFVAVIAIFTYIIVAYTDRTSEKCLEVFLPALGETRLVRVLRYTDIRRDLLTGVLSSDGRAIRVAGIFEADAEPCPF